MVTVLVLSLEACLGEADLQLGSRQVDVSHHLGAGVLHLQTGVELQEVEAAVLAIEVLHCTCADVSHHLSQLHCTLRRENNSMLTIEHLYGGLVVLRLSAI